MDVAPFNIFENQVIPMGLHNLSKSFKPNLATTRVFSLGTKFIPVWKSMKIVKPFAKFEDFRRRMSNKVFFEEISPGTFVRNKNFHLKGNFWTDNRYPEIDSFCYNIRDGIANLIDEQKSVLKQNLSKQEFTELQKIIVNKNEIHVVNDTDKNLGAAISDKEDVVNECKRQLYDIYMTNNKYLMHNDPTEQN